MIRFMQRFAVELFAVLAIAAPSLVLLLADTLAGIDWKHYVSADWVLPVNLVAAGVVILLKIAAQRAVKP